VRKITIQKSDIISTKATTGDFMAEHDTPYTQSDVKEAQWLLKALGYTVLPPDPDEEYITIKSDDACILLDGWGTEMVGSDEGALARVRIALHV
jgi:hypothetical protein